MFKMITEFWRIFQNGYSVLIYYFITYYHIHLYLYYNEIYFLYYINIKIFACNRDFPERNVL